jgi:hypothetical protein
MEEVWTDMKELTEEEKLELRKWALERAVKVVEIDVRYLNTSMTNAVEMADRFYMYAIEGVPRAGR